MADRKIERFPVNPILQRDAWMKLRDNDVTASTVGALFGVHDYQTAFGLWAEKTGAIDPSEPDDLVIDESGDEITVPPIIRGHMLEPIVAQLIKEVRPHWRLRKSHMYFRDPDIRIGATPDYIVHDKDRGRGICQIKTAGLWPFKAKWVDPDTREVVPPLWIGLQALTEADLVGADWACIACLVIDNKLSLRIIDVPINRKLIDESHRRVREFWQMIADGKEPDPDYGRDGAILRMMYPEDDGSEIDLSDDQHITSLVNEREALSATKKDSEKAIDRINNELIHRLGNAARATIDGGTITFKTVSRKAYSVAAKTYRAIRVNKKDNADG